MTSIRVLDPATVPFADLRPAFPVDAAMCLTETATTELGGGFVRIDGAMTFDVSYDEAIFVVEGALRLRRGDESVTVPAGSSALIGAGGEVEYDVDVPTLFFFVRHPRT